MHLANLNPWVIGEIKPLFSFIPIYQGMYVITAFLEKCERKIIKARLVTQSKAKSFFQQ